MSLITICLDCGGCCDEHFSGDEGWTVCNECQNVEGPTTCIEEVDWEKYEQGGVLDLSTVPEEVLG